MGVTLICSVSRKNILVSAFTQLGLHSLNVKARNYRPLSIPFLISYCLELSKYVTNESSKVHEHWLMCVLSFTVKCLLWEKPDWMRIGAFSIDSSVALLTEKLTAPVKISYEDNIENMLQSHGYCLLNNVKNGIWIAGINLINPPIICLWEYWYLFMKLQNQYCNLILYAFV